MIVGELVPVELVVHAPEPGLGEHRGARPRKHSHENA